MTLPADAIQGSARTVNCCSYGVPFRIVAGSESLYAALPQLLPLVTEMDSEEAADAETFTLLPPENGHGFRYYAGAELVQSSDEAGPVLQVFSRNLMTHVAEFCPDRVFVHAGVAGWKGRALVLPGKSFAGKSTLTAALVRAGATYYSDEYAVVDEMGWVHPYARDLRMRNPGSGIQRSMPVAALQGHAGTTPLRVAQVLFTRYEEGASWNPESVSPGMAVLETMGHSLPVQRTPRRVMASLTAMLEGATAWTSARGEADATAESLLRALDLETQTAQLEESLPR